MATSVKSSETIVYPNSKGYIYSNKKLTRLKNGDKYGYIFFVIDGCSAIIDAKVASVLYEPSGVFSIRPYNNNSAGLDISDNGANTLGEAVESMCELPHTEVDNLDDYKIIKSSTVIGGVCANISDRQDYCIFSAVKGSKNPVTLCTIEWQSQSKTLSVLPVPEYTEPDGNRGKLSNFTRAGDWMPIDKALLVSAYGQDFISRVIEKAAKSCDAETNPVKQKDELPECETWGYRLTYALQRALDEQEVQPSNYTCPILDYMLSGSRGMTKEIVGHLFGICSDTEAYWDDLPNCWNNNRYAGLPPYRKISDSVKKHRGAYDNLSESDKQKFRLDIMRLTSLKCCTYILCNAVLEAIKRSCKKGEDDETVSYIKEKIKQGQHGRSEMKCIYLSALHPDIAVLNIEARSISANKYSAVIDVLINYIDRVMSQLTRTLCKKGRKDLFKFTFTNLCDIAQAGKTQLDKVTYSALCDKKGYISLLCKGLLLNKNEDAFWCNFPLTSKSKSDLTHYVQWMQTPMRI